MKTPGSLHRRCIWVCATVLIVGCGQDPTMPEGHFDPIRIGFITSEAGSLKTLGPHWTNACLLAVQQVNATGGALPGRQVEAIVTDDETEASVAYSLAQKLIGQDHVIGIIGAPTSGASLEVAKVAGPSAVPQISGTSTSPLLNALDVGGNDIHPYFFRTVPGDHHQGWVLGSAARGQFNNENFDLACESMALVYLDDAYGRPFAASIRDRFVALGGTIAIEVPFEDGRPSYQDEVFQLMGSGPDCIAMVAYVESGGTIVREWYSTGGDDSVRWLGTDGVRDTGFADEAGVHAAGIFGTAPASDPNRQELLSFRDAYRTTFNSEPGVLAESVYDATILLLLGIARAGTTDGTTVRNALFDVSAWVEGEESFGPGEILGAMEKIREGQSIDYEGAGGNVDFLPATGDVVADYEVWMWNGSDFQRQATVTARTIIYGLGSGGG